MGAGPMTNEELDAVEALAKATPETVEAVRPPSVKLRTLLAVGNDVVGFVEGPSREALVAFYTRARGSTLALIAGVREHRSDILCLDASVMDLRAERDALRAEVERLRAENEVLGRENAYLAPRLRAGQRIFAAVDKIDPKFTREANGTTVDPFQHDDRCEAFLLAWSAHLRGKTDAAPRMWGPTPSVTEAAAHQARLGGASMGAPWLVREVDEAPFPSRVIGVVRVQAINIGFPNARPSWFPTIAELDCGVELDPAAYEWCALSWDGVAMPRIDEPAAAVEQATNDDVSTNG